MKEKIIFLVAIGIWFVVGVDLCAVGGVRCH